MYNQKNLTKNRFFIRLKSTSKFYIVFYSTFQLLFGQLYGQTVSFDTAFSKIKEGSSIKIQINLSSASSKVTKIDFSIEGGTAYGKGYRAAKAEVFGTGNDYKVNTGTISFTPGTLKYCFTLTTLDDSTIENDETFILRLSNPVNASLGASNHFVGSIIDNDRKNLINVKTLGAKGDSSTDDTKAIQSAIDSLSSLGGGVLLFPPGTYITTSVTLRENITYEGYGAILKRPSMQGKWMRTFQAFYSGAKDSRPMVIKGLTFDGNSSNQGKFDNWELEQAHLLMFMGDPTKAGRVKGFVEDCFFKEGVGDAVSIYTNADVTVYNSVADDVFRGGVVITGGYTLAKVYKFRTGRKWNHSWATGIDIEVDGQGYKKSMIIDVTLDGLYLGDGDLDIYAKGSTITANNITSLYGNGYNISGGGSSVLTFTNCKIAIGGADSYERILWPGNLTFENCSFVTGKFRSGGSYYGLEIWWNHAGIGTNYTNQSVSFKNCTFEVDSSIKSSDVTHAIHTLYDDISKKNTLYVEHCTISRDYDVGLFIGDGGTWVVNDIVNEAELSLQSSGTGRSSDISINGMYTKGSKYAAITLNNTNAKLSQQNTIVHQTSNFITANKGISNIALSGHRIIYGTTTPTSSTHGFINDIYCIISGDTVHQWKCTKAGYFDGTNTITSSWSSLADDTLSSVAFSSPQNNITEGGNQSSILVNRTGSVMEALAVELHISGTAINKEDYYFQPSIPIIHAGDSFSTLAFIPVDDTLMEQTEIITLSVRDGTTYQTDSNLKKTLNLTDNDTLSSMTNECISTSLKSYKKEVDYPINIYPNPAYNFVMIRYSLMAQSPVKISLYDLLGKEVMQIKNENQNYGEHQIVFNICSLQQGIYEIKIETNNKTQTEILCKPH